MGPPNLMSTAERALIDIAQDRRYWIIHSITIPSLFVGGVIFMLSGFVYKLFGALNFNKYFDKDNSSISLIKDRSNPCRCIPTPQPEMCDCFLTTL